MAPAAEIPAPPGRPPSSSTRPDRGSKLRSHGRSASARIRSPRTSRSTARRRERSEKSATLTLTLDAELRYTVTGGGVIRLNGWDERARTLSAIWYAPDDFAWDRVHEIFHRLRAGTAVRLDGYWRSRNFKGTKLFEFVAQYLTIGDGARIP
jgi:hypothetical protein